MSASLKQCIVALAKLTQSNPAMGVKKADVWLIKMSTTMESTWTPRQKHYVYDLTSKYVKELKLCGLDFTQVAQPPDPSTFQAPVRPVPTSVKETVVEISTPPPTTEVIKRAQIALQMRTCGMLANHKFFLRYPDSEWLDTQVKKIPYQYRHRNKAAGQWEITLDKAEGWVVVEFKIFLGQERFILDGSVIADIAVLMEKARLIEAYREQELEKSFAEDAVLEIPGFPVDKMRGFQRSGALYAIEKKRCFIAFPPGLGKTLMAIAVIEHQQSYPAIVICPAALRHNWIREINMWNPKRKATLDHTLIGVEAHDIFVMSYERMVRSYDQLEEIDWKAIVADESQALKNSKSKRSKTARDLAKVSKAPIRLCLTGTPIDNAPYEFSPQLQFLGLMEAMGGSDYFFRYYCDGYSRGANHLKELNTRLRKVGYLRREKEEVLLELPPKQRSIQVLEIDNEPEYQRAEKDFINWLKGYVRTNPHAFEGAEDDDSIEAKEAVAIGRAGGAEKLVQLNYLKRLAMQGMLENAKAWIEDFIESGQKLVVFCHHIEAQQQVYGLFEDVAVWTMASAGPQAAVEAFQKDPAVKIIVCSLKADSTGHTLTAASNVVFIELGWTPTIHEQASDRVHRIGQRDSVTAWYLIAKGTVYERIVNLIEGKRAVVEAATSGKDSKSNGSVMRDLLKQMAA